MSSPARLAFAPPQVLAAAKLLAVFGLGGHWARYRLRAYRDECRRRRAVARHTGSRADVLSLFHQSIFQLKSSGRAYRNETESRVWGKGRCEAARGKLLG